MKLSSESTFECFVATRTKDLLRIASFTAGQHEFHDVVHESWLIARDLSKDETLADLQNVEFQNQVLQAVHHVFTSPAERIFRKSIRLDSGGDDEDTSSGTHPLMRILTSDSPDPLDELLNQDEATVSAQVEHSVDLTCSLAGAYISLLNHFCDWRKVAEHLDISTLTTGKHYRDAVFLARYQHDLHFPMPKGFLPGPWRNPRVAQFIRQLMFEFTYQLSFQLPALSAEL